MKPPVSARILQCMRLRSVPMRANIEGAPICKEVPQFENVSSAWYWE